MSRLDVARRELLKVLSAGLDGYSGRDADYWFWEVVRAARHEALVAHYMKREQGNG